MGSPEITYVDRIRLNPSSLEMEAHPHAAILRKVNGFYSQCSKPLNVDFSRAISQL